MKIHSLAPSIFRRENKVDDIIEELPTAAFSGNQLLMEVSLPRNLKIIGSNAFLNCKLLSKVRISITVKEIRARAFLGCRTLQELTLPAGLTCIQEETFSRCSKLKNMIVPLSVVVIEHGAFSYCSALLSVELPEGLKMIESRAFAHCEQLKNIEIPTTVNRLGEHAFIKCERSLEVRLGTNTRRFHDLPLHRLCYYQAHYTLATKQQRLEEAIQMDETTSGRMSRRSGGRFALCRKNDTLRTHDFDLDNLGLLLRLDGCLVDSFNMTPLHILVLSARPSLLICETLLALYPSNVTIRDRYGNTPIDYACMMNAPVPIMKALLRTQRQQLNSFQDEEQLRCENYISLTNQYDSLELLLYFTHRYFHARMKPLGLGLWQEDVVNEIVKLSSLPNKILRVEQLKRLDFCVSQYEQKENLSLVELALWKGRMKAESPRGLHGASRKTCQIKCGADVVIPLLMPYLNDGEHFNCNRY